MAHSAKSSQLPETGVFKIIGTPEVKFRNKYNAAEKINGVVVSENDQVVYKSYNSTTRGFEKVNVDPNNVDLEYIIPVRFPEPTLVTKLWIPEKDRQDGEMYRDMALDEARLKLNKTAFANLASTVLLDIALSSTEEFSMNGFIVSYKNKDASFEKDGKTVAYKQTIFKRATSSDKVKFSAGGTNSTITEDDLPF